MINILKYDVVIVKFPFASSLKYKARPAIVVSSNDYNLNKRGKYQLSKNLIKFSYTLL